MTSKAKHTAIVLGGALALASGAYALGAQSGDGTASATGSKTSSASAPGFRHDGFRARPGFGPALDELAAKLGVKPADLRTALQQVKSELAPPMGDRGDKLADLASALGVSEPKLRAALQKVRPERGMRHERGADFAEALAAKLGVSAAKVRTAFEAHGADIAKTLGVSEARLKQALGSLHVRGGRKDDIAAGLAKELGLSTSKVQAAFEKLRAGHEADHQKLEDEFASTLAAKLDIDVAKVKSALEEFGPHRHP